MNRVRLPWFRREMSAGRFALVMNLPTLLCLGLVLAYPVVYAAYLSVHRVGLAQLRRGEFAFTGWENYGRVLEDPLFWVAIKNTLIFTVITVGSEIVLAVAIALLINQAGIWTSRITRFLILLPYAIPPICNGLIWSFLYSFQFGFLNRILFSPGLIRRSGELGRQSRHRPLCRHRALHLAHAALRHHPGACSPAGHPARALRAGGDRRRQRLASLHGRSPGRCCSRSSPSS